MCNPSPLRYPGGKQRVADRIAALIPAGTNTLYSPFLGGGSVELKWLEKNPRGHLVARDALPPLVDFWSEVAKGNASLLASEARKYLGLSKNLFSTMKAALQHGNRSSTEQAVAFYVINRASFSGATQAGGMGNADRFTASSCDKLAAFPEDLARRMDVRKADVFDSIRRRVERFTPDTCIYLDPPYFLEDGKNKLYGNKGEMHDSWGYAEHKRLAGILRDLSERGVKWVLSYNDSLEIRELYEGLRMIPATWKYGMSKNKDGGELFVFSNAITA